MVSCLTHRKSLLYAMAGATLFACTLSHASDVASALYERGDEQAVLGDLTAAIASYREGLALLPDDEQARVRLAMLQRNAGDRQSAIATLQNGLKRNDSSALFHVRLGELQEAAENPAAARKHYMRATQLASDSAAGLDAAANLADLDSRSNVDSAQPSIGWSKGPKPRNMSLATRAPETDTTRRELELLKSNLDGEWCLELTDRYRRESAMCVSDSSRGDLDLKDLGTEVGFSVSPDARTVATKGMESATGLRWPEGKALSVERSLGDRTVIQTVVYERNDFVEFSFSVGNSSRQCMQLTANRRGDEHRVCANRYTFCRCAR